VGQKVDGVPTAADCPAAPWLAGWLCSGALCVRDLGRGCEAGRRLMTAGSIARACAV
jgi:hypothetical protein